MKLHKLSKETTEGYAVWGCMWEQGRCSRDTDYICYNGQGEEVPMQSRITAYWPDHSVKWTAHTADGSRLGEAIEVLPGIPAVSAQRIAVEESREELVLDTGGLRLAVPKSGEYLVKSITLDGKERASDLRPVLVLEEPRQIEGMEARLEKPFAGTLEAVELEERGDLRCIVKYTGCHVNEEGERKLPFVIRMTVLLEQSRIQFMHTFLYDGDENRDFLKGIGITMKTPLAGKPCNRHIKVTGDHGVFHESVLPLISWRPRVPEGLYERQMKGQQLILTGQEERTVEQIEKDAPCWDTYTICQDSPSHFAIRKKLAPSQCSMIDSLHGKHSRGGLAYGSEAGYVMACEKDFREKYPSGYTVGGLTGTQGTFTVWFWSPEASAFDFRHYAQRGYNQVCYEGYDYKGADPDGIACTNECSIAFGDGCIPEDEVLERFTQESNRAVIYVGTPQFYHSMRAFGYWSLPSVETETERWLEEQLEQIFAFYQQETEQRNWYGMFNYGDFMHTYDKERHQWRYDIGGFAWDNTELVPTLWLWLYFLRTGREEVFTFAEKLSRHASEVDVYHMGKYKGLGSRHNVRHWGCPCKEARIAMAAHHRVFYYLTGDRRMEDIFEELKDNEYSFLNKDPLGDFYEKKDMVYPSHARSGPDWSSLCSNWMTRWERFDDEAYRDKILVGMQDIKDTPLGLLSGPDFEFDPETCHLRYIGERTTGGNHLQICMGAPQIWFEMADLLKDEEWKRLMAQHGKVYMLPREQQLAQTDGLIGDRELTFPFMAAAMGAYGAAYLQDKKLAEYTWSHLLETILTRHNAEGFAVKYIANQGNQEALQEIPWIGTNFVAQFGLNVIMALDFIREELPGTLEEAKALAGKGEQERFRRA